MDRTQRDLQEKESFFPLPPVLGWGLGAFFVALFLGQGLAFMAANSQTSDEAVHLTAGYAYLSRQDFRLNPEHPPLIKELAALSVYLRFGLPFEPDPDLWQEREQWRIGRDFLYGSSIPAQQILTWGRLPNLLLGAVLVGLIGCWAYRLWGQGAALLGMGLASLEPNLVVHSSLVTTDLGAALFGFLAVYLLWEYTRAASLKLLVGVGAAVGAALAAKYSAILLPVILGAILFFHLLARGDFISSSFRRGRPRRFILGRTLTGIPPFLVVLGVAALVLSGSYLFQGFSDWWSGMESVIVHREIGHQAFFWGEYSFEGWLSYFPVAFLIKTPIGILILLAASLLFCRTGEKLRGRDLIYLLVPVVTLFAATAFGRINIGLRHVLPIYPFLLLISSRIATIQFRKPQVMPLLLALALVLTGIPSLRVAPHQLAYFNELVGGPEEGYRYLSDSNIDWGQGLGGCANSWTGKGCP